MLQYTTPRVFFDDGSAGAGPPDHFPTAFTEHFIWVYLAFHLGLFGISLWFTLRNMGSACQSRRRSMWWCSMQTSQGTAICNINGQLFFEFFH